ncbi:hypothetical protein ISN45_Aa08g007550 [Arabidopsis thaliana x Arabidopsis arenosa]|uniref:DUF1985 domain-containing protein n=1 Tax=Arabidopsis thaliana x Arabidopsis arenosa TaxID=1240361 RepID=A0A8T1XF10_9BRAS|nr:hypothetical protein ISN45_Aa08g007550 [Arabidopsis thaliana x Arabidopsis arenosa]
MDAEHSIIASSSQTSIPLPSTLFKIGEESRGASSINNHSTFKYVKLVKDILSEPLFNKLKSTFLGPIIKAGLRRGGGKQMGDGLGFSASLVRYLVVRQITTTKKDELWFYFNNQPMRFTLREFHLVTGLPCYAEDKIQVEENINWPMVTKEHTPEDLLAQLRALGNDDEESKLRLAMLLLLESIFLLKYALNKPRLPFGQSYTVDRVHPTDKIISIFPYSLILVSFLFYNQNFFSFLLFLLSSLSGRILLFIKFM